MATLDDVPVGIVKEVETVRKLTLAAGTKKPNHSSSLCNWHVQINRVRPHLFICP